jgi:hypothetical protein
MDDLLNFADLDTFAHNRAGTGPDRTEEKAEAAARARAAYLTAEAEGCTPEECKAAAARAAEG